MGCEVVVREAHAAGVAGELRAVVLVEGLSDQAAVAALAERRGRDLAAEGVAIVPMGGATSIGRYLERFGPAGANVVLAGLCDANEEPDFRRGLMRAGLANGPAGADLEAMGFFVCIADLEDELIRALGHARVEALVQAQGELRGLRTFQRQPAQLGRPVQDQLRRFMGTRSGRKIRYGRLLVEALDLADVPRPLDGVLAAV